MVTKLLHWTALRISDLGEFLFDLGGALECWCDERANRDHDLCFPEPDDVFGELPRVPITMLDDYKGMSTQQVYDKLKEDTAHG